VFGYEQLTMNALTDSIGSFFTSSNSGVILFGAAVGVSFMILTWVVTAASAAMTSPLRRRLDNLRSGEDSGGGARRRVASWLDRLRPHLEPKKAAKRQGLKERLQRAGLRSERALVLLYAAKLVSAALVPALVMPMVSAYADKGFSGGVLALLTILAAVVGWLMPNIYVERRFQSRRLTIMEALPDALDLLVACTEAGMGLNAALERVAEQMPDSSAELAEELQLVNVEIRAGVDRGVALRNLADRTGAEELRGLVALINHSMRFGTGIAETLRIYSEEFRDRRMQRAEEIGAMVGTKLIFPLVFCIFPSFFLVAVGPAVIGVIRAIGNVSWGINNQ